MKTIGITGGSGFIGKHLTDLMISKGYKVIIFTRNPQGRNDHDHISYTYWDAGKGKCDLVALKKLSAVVHLAGAGIADKRWTEKRKKEIVESRVKSTQFLVAQLKAYAPHCKTFVAASAIGFYGPDRDNIPPFKEDAHHYNDFLSNTCVAWEKESMAAQDFIRSVILRFGIVLGKDSAAYTGFAKPLKYGIKPILGSGKQIISWIHIDDLCELILFSLNNEKIKGVYNAVAPTPVSQKQLIQTMANSMGGVKIPFPVPAPLLKILLGGVSSEALKSCTVSDEKLISTGFQFKYGKIESAVDNLVGK